MIYRLRRKFILISTVSVLSVIALVFVMIFALNVSTMNRNMDMLADRVSEGDGRFPGSMEEKPPPDKMPPRNDRDFEFITPETPFSTRHFSVFFDSNGNVIRTNTESIYSITDEVAVEYAEKVISSGSERGWISSYRYKLFSGVINAFLYGVLFFINGNTCPVANLFIAAGERIIHCGFTAVWIAR